MGVWGVNSGSVSHIKAPTRFAATLWPDRESRARFRTEWSVTGSAATGKFRLTHYPMGACGSGVLVSGEMGRQIQVVMAPWAV